MIDKAQLLQQVLASLRVPREPAGATRAEAPVPGPARRPGQEASAAPVRRGSTLGQQLRRRIAAIAPDDPHRRRRVLRVTVEGCLAAEWGGELSADPAFHALVDQVVHHLESDPALQALVDETLGALSVPDPS